MRCPFCGHGETQVKDSRPADDNSYYPNKDNDQIKKKYTSWKN